MAVSVQLIFVLIFLCVINFYFVQRNSWRYIFAVMFILLLFVPADSIGIISGHSMSSAGVMNISIVGYDALIVCVCNFINKKGNINIKKIGIYTFIGIVPIILIRLISEQFDALSNKMLDSYIIPVIVAILIIDHMTLNDLKFVMRFICNCITINAVVACLEYVFGKSILFHDYYMGNVEWYVGIFESSKWNIAFRPTTFLGHPLINGLYFILAFVYLINNRSVIKNRMLYNLQMTVLLAGILSTNSRGALLVLLGYVLFYALKRKQYTKLSILAFIGLVIFAMVDVTELYYAFFNRDVTGTSLLQRYLALQNFLRIDIVTLLRGTGYNNTVAVLNELGMNGNFEISYLIIMLENGILAFMVWCITLCNLYSRHMVYYYKGVWVKSTLNGMILCFCVMAATSNLIGDPGTTNYTLWSLIAFSRVANTRKVRNQIVEVVN